MPHYKQLSYTGKVMMCYVVAFVFALGLGLFLANAVKADDDVPPIIDDTPIVSTTPPAEETIEIPTTTLPIIEDTTTTEPVVETPTTTEPIIDVPKILSNSGGNGQKQLFDIELDCSDYEDNDSDGDTDCNDSDCYADPFCFIEDFCDDPEAYNYEAMGQCIYDPDVPSGITLSKTTSTILVSWDWAVDATSYTVSSTVPGSASVDTSGRSYLFPELNTSTEYLFQVKSNNIYSSSSFSDVYSTTTDSGEDAPLDEGGDSLTICASGCTFSSITEAFASTTVPEGSTFYVSSTYETSADQSEGGSLVFPTSSITLDCQNNSEAVISPNSTGIGIISMSNSSTIQNCTLASVIIVGHDDNYTNFSILDNIFVSSSPSSIVLDTIAGGWMNISNNIGLNGISIDGGFASGTISNNIIYSLVSTSVDYVRVGIVLGSVSDFSVVSNTIYNYVYNSPSPWSVMISNTTNTIFASNTIIYPVDLHTSYPMALSIGNSYNVTIVGNYLDLRILNSTTTERIIGIGNSSGGITSVQFSHNTFAYDATHGGYEVMWLDNTGGDLMNITSAYNIFANFGSAQNYWSVNGGGEGSTFVSDYDGFWNVPSSTIGTTTNWVTTNPYFKTSDADTTNDLELAPFSPYLDVNGTEDIGAYSNAKRDPLVIYFDPNGEIDYTTVDATSTAQILNWGFTVVTTTGHFYPGPTGATASSISTSSLTISWADNSSSEDGFYVQMTTGSTWVEVTTTPANVTSSIAESLETLTQYQFRVQAFQGSDTSDYSTTAVTTTISNLPSAPVLLPPSHTSTSISISWEAVSGAETYIVSSTNGNGSDGFHLVMADTATNIGVDPWSEYYYQVMATNTYGEGPWSEIGYVAATGTAPANLAVTLINSTTMQLTWNDNSGGTDVFVFASSTDGNNFSDTATTTAGATSTLFEGLTPRTNYWFKVAAKDPDGELMSPYATIYGDYTQDPNTYTVCEEGCDFQTLTGAFASSSVISGDILIVSSTYSSTTEQTAAADAGHSGSIWFSDHRDMTVDCQNNGVVISPSSTGTGLIRMYGGNTIQNCSFVGTQITNHGVPLTSLEDFTILNNTFATDTTSSISLVGIGTVYISDNVGLNGIYIVGFSSGTIANNEVDVNFPSGDVRGLRIDGIVDIYPTSNIVISSNTVDISSYLNGIGWISFNSGLGVGGNDNILVDHNRFLISDTSTTTAPLAGISSVTNITFSNNYFDSHLVPQGERLIDISNGTTTADMNVSFNHNTFAITGAHQVFYFSNWSASGNIFMTSTYNIYANFDSAGGGQGINTGNPQEGIYQNVVVSDYDAFWRLTTPITGGYSATPTNYLVSDPYFKLGNVDTNDDLELAPFSPYLDVTSTEDIGAYSVARATEIRFNPEGPIDYTTIDATSTAQIINLGLPITVVGDYFYPGPTDVTLSDVSTSSITVSWDDNSSDEGGFGIQMSTSGDWVDVITDLPADTTSSIVGSLNLDTLYQFRVKAFKSDYSSDYSASDATTTLEGAHTYYIGSVAEGDDFDNIKAAFDSASVLAGDTLIVSSSYTSSSDQGIWNSNVIQFSKDNITLDCQNSGAVISTNPSGSGYVRLTSGSTIQNCVLDSMNFDVANNASILNNTFRSSSAPTQIGISDDGSINISSNTGLNGISLDGFTSGVVSNNTIYILAPNTESVVGIYFSDINNVNISSNTIYNYVYDTDNNSGIYLNGSNNSIDITSNTIIYPINLGNLGSAAIRSNNSSDINVIGNYVDVSAVVSTTHGGVVMDFATNDTGTYTAEYSHNTVVFNSAAGFGLRIVGNEQNPELFVTSSYNIYANLGAHNDTVVALSNQGNGTASLRRFNSNYDGFWNVHLIGSQEEYVTSTNPTTTNPYFKTSDIDTTNDLELAPFSPYLDVTSTEDIGAYSAVRRDPAVIYFDPGTSTIDYITVDATSTAAILDLGIQVVVAEGHYYPGPTGAVVSDLASSSVTVSWTDNSGILPNEDGFVLERSTNGTDFNNTIILNSDTTSTMVTGLNISTPYWFRIVAFVVSSTVTSTSDYSNIVTANTLGNPHTYYVGSVAGGDDFDSVSAALDSETVVPGDILVVSSSYSSSAESGGEIDFSNKTDITLDCLDNDITISPNSDGVAEIKMSNNSIIQNCNFNAVKIRKSLDNLSNFSILNNTFASNTTSSIHLDGIGAVDISDNVGLNGISVEDFTSGTIHNNIIYGTYIPDGDLVAGIIVSNVDDLTLSDNTIYNTVYSSNDSYGIDIEDNSSNITVVSNTIIYPTSLEEEAWSSVLQIDDSSNVNVVGNYIDTSAIVSYGGNKVMNIIDVWVGGVGNTVTAEFSHNTFIFNDGVEDALRIGRNGCCGRSPHDIYVTSTYNIFDNVGASSNGVYGLATNGEDGGYQKVLYSNYDGFWNLESVVDNDSGDVNLNNSVVANPFFKTGDADTANNYEPAPVSPLLAEDGNEIGAYTTTTPRRTTININATGTVDYINIDANNTTGIGGALKTGDTLNIATGTYSAFAIASSTIITSTITIQGVGAGTVISAGTEENGILLTGIDNAIVKNLVVQNASGTISGYTITRQPFVYDSGEGEHVYNNLLSTLFGDLSGEGISLVAKFSETGLVVVGSNDFDITSHIGSTPPTWNLGLLHFVADLDENEENEDYYLTVYHNNAINAAVFGEEEGIGFDSDITAAQAVWNVSSGESPPITVECWVTSTLVWNGSSYDYHAPESCGIPTTTYQSGDPAINFTQNGGYAGIKISGGISSTIENVTSTGNYYGVNFTNGSYSNSVVSSTISDNTTYDIYSDSNYNNELNNNALKNTSFNSASSSITGTGNVTVYYTARAYVTDASSTPVSGATVNFVPSNTTTSVATVVTDETGYTPATDYILSWMMSSSSPTSTTAGGYNPMVVTAVAEAFYPASTTAELISPNQLFTLGATSSAIYTTSSIQAAIDSASDGSTVVVSADYNYESDSYPIIFTHDNITLDCHSDGALIRPTTTEVGEIQMSSSSAIKNCSFASVKITNVDSGAADLTVTDNIFATNTTSTVDFDGSNSGTIDISGNTGMSLVGINGFTTGTIYSNTVYESRADRHSLAGIVVRSDQNITVSSNTIYATIFYDNPYAPGQGIEIGVSATDTPSGINVTGNHIIYHEESSYALEGAISINNASNVNISYNVIDASLLVNTAAVTMLTIEGGDDATNNINITHNTLVMTPDSGSQPSFVSVTAADNNNIFVTSTYNLYVNLNSDVDSANGFRTFGSSSIYSGYDVFYGIDSDLECYNDDCTMDNVFDAYPFFRDNTWHLVPFSPFLDINGTEDIGAYSAVRRHTIYIDPNRAINYDGPNAEDFVDMTSTEHLAYAHQSNDTIVLYSGDYSPIDFQGDWGWGQNTTFQGATTGTVINIVGAGDGLTLEHVNGSTIKNLTFQNASTSISGFNMSVHPFDYNGIAYDIIQLESEGDDPVFGPGGLWLLPDLELLDGGPAIITTSSNDISDYVSASPQNWSLGLVSLDYGGMLYLTSYYDQDFDNDGVSGEFDAKASWCLLMTQEDACVINPDAVFEGIGVTLNIDYFATSTFVWNGSGYDYNGPTGVDGEPAPTTTYQSDPAIPTISRAGTSYPYAGIKIYRSRDNLIENVTSTNNGIGILFINDSDDSEGNYSYDNVVSSSVLTGNLGYDVYSAASGPTNTLYNTAFSMSSSSVTGAGVVEAYFKARALVTSTGVGVDDMTVNFKDSSDTATTTVTSTVSGYTPYTDYLLAWVMSSSSPTSTTAGGYNPFTVSAMSTSTSEDLISPNQLFTLIMSGGGDFAPMAPSSVEVVSVSTSSVVLSWTDNADMEEGFFIEASTSTEGDGIYSPVATLVSETPSATGTITTTISYLEPGTLYWFQVASYRGSSSSEYIKTESGTSTLAGGSTTTLANLSATPASATGIVLDWDSFEGASYYNISTSSDGNEYSFIASTTESYYDVNSLSPTTTYYYMVTALDGSENIIASSIASTTTYPVPDIPTNVTTTAVSSTEIDLLWDAPVYSTDYNVYRTTTAPGTFDEGNLLSGTMSNHYFYDYGVEPSTTYYYHIKAVSGDASSSPSEMLSVTTLSEGPSTPTAPSGIHDIVSTSSIELSWTDNSDNEDGFVIEQYFDEGEHYSVVASVATDTTSTVISDLTPNTEYWFQVAAYNSVGTSTYASTSIYTNPDTPLAPTIGVITTSTVEISLNQDNNPTSTPYVIWDSNIMQCVYGDNTLGSCEGDVVSKTIAEWATTTIIGLTPDTNYEFGVTAIGNGVVFSAGPTSSVHTLSDAPTTLTVTGTIYYYDGAKKVVNATVVLEDSSNNILTTAITDSNGLYTFSSVTSGQDYFIRISSTSVPTTSARGVTSADQLKIGRHVVGLELFNSVYKKIAADMNWSGSITSADQFKIGRFFVGIDATPISGVWKFYSTDRTPTTTPAEAYNYRVTGTSSAIYRHISGLASDTPAQDFTAVKMGDVNNSWTN